MKNSKNGLDEMQKQRRNSIGNQSFMLMFYALLLDSGLYGAGIRWLGYPANIMVIITVCMSIYLVRTISANAYLPPSAKRKKPIVLTIVAITLSVVFAVAAYNLFGESIAQNAVENMEDYSALILLAVSSVGLIISLIVAIIAKSNNKKDCDE